MKWSSEDLLKLEVLLEIYPIHKVAQSLGRGESGVKKKMSELGLKSKVRKTHRGERTWTEEEEAKLARAIYDKSSTKGIARSLGKSEKAIRLKASRMGYSLEYNAWTEDEIEMLSKMVSEGQSWEDISKAIGRPASACRNKRDRLWLDVNKKGWTGKEENYLLRERAKGTSFAEISTHLNKSVLAVRRKHARLKKGLL
jgi:hypothetical protein